MSDHLAVPASDGAVWRRHAFLVTALGIGLSLFQLAVTYIVAVDPLFHLAVFLSLTCSLLFLADAGPAPSSRGRPIGRWASWTFAAGSLAAGAMFVARFDVIRERWPVVDALSPLDLACGVILLAVVVEATRRAVGLVLVWVIALFLAYALFGHHLPGLLYHRPLSIAEVVDQLVFTSNGVFGAPLEVAATYVYMFVLFGTALELSGGGEFMFRIASAIAGRTVGGPAKVAVVSSALYGSISGSPTSNVMTTGLFSIPLMKRSGVQAEVAAAIEAVAATGGALLPPVMGSAAFLMAELTGISYFDICVAAVTPALLFYACLFLQVHFKATELGMSTGHHGFHPRTHRALGWGPPSCSARSPHRVSGTRLVADDRRRHRDGAGHRGELAPARHAARGAADPAPPRRERTPIARGHGRMRGCRHRRRRPGDHWRRRQGHQYHLHGGERIAHWRARRHDGRVYVLGMGMPVPSAYIVTAVLAGPPLAALGVTPMAANLFILYYASLSAITPPVAVANFAAASIAQVNPNQVGLHAVRFGIIAFVIPFVFVYRPELLLIGSAVDVVRVIALSGLGVFLIAGALGGFMRRRLTGWERAASFVAGTALIAPGLVSQVGGVTVAIVVLWRTFRHRGSGRTAARESETGEIVKA